MNRRLKAARLVQNIVRRRLAHRAMKKNIRAKQEENRKAEIRLRKQNAYVLRIQRIARVLIARRVRLYENTTERMQNRKLTKILFG